MSLAEVTVPMREHENIEKTTFHEQKVGRILFRVTSVYNGDIDLARTLEDLIVRRVLDCDDGAQAEENNYSGK